MDQRKDAERHRGTRDGARKVAAVSPDRRFLTGTSRPPFIGGGASRPGDEDPRVTYYYGSEALAATDRLADLYREAFCVAPWNEDEVRVGEFTARLRSNVERPEFCAIVAESGGRPAGFATAWRTQAPFPTDRRYGEVLSLLGDERVASCLVGALEIDELAVAPWAQGQGLGAQLLTAVTDLDNGKGVWLLTSTRAPAAVRFYRRRGWRQITGADGAESIVVFLSPQHPHRCL